MESFNPYKKGKVEMEKSFNSIPDNGFNPYKKGKVGISS